MLSLKPTSKSNTQNLMFPNMLWNTPAFTALPPAPLIVITRFMMTPFSTQLDHLSPFTCHLLYATILESTTVYQALHALCYFSTNDTLTQLMVLFQIYSTLCTLFTRATWCFTSAPNLFWTATVQESPTILTLDLLYIEGLDCFRIMKIRMEL